MTKFKICLSDITLTGKSIFYQTVNVSESIQIQKLNQLIEFIFSFTYNVYNYMI